MSVVDIYDQDIVETHKSQETKLFLKEKENMYLRKRFDFFE